MHQILLAFLLWSSAALGNYKIILKDDKSQCYVNNKPSYCESEFTNIVSDSVITASSTCGLLGQTERICNLSPFCVDCNSNSRPRTASRLVKPSTSSDKLVWISDIVGTSAGENIVNITLNFGKNFDVYWMKMLQSGKMPDAIAIYKAIDNKNDEWKAWQYFSTDCYKAFRLPTSNPANSQMSTINLKEVQCYLLNKTNPTVLFAPDTRKSNKSEIPDAFYDWITASDLRISLIRFLDNQQPQHDSIWPLRNHFRRESGFSHEDFRFALDNLEVGARCKCNGHSNKCIRETFSERDPLTGALIEKLGPLKCDCSHNTIGVDCESCKRGFFDLPWARATQDKPFQCKACSCNDHSGECKFSVKLYRATKGQSGGICIACQHHTQGSNCDECIQGFTRNQSFPIGHMNACQECDCNLHSNECTFSPVIYASSNMQSGGVCVECQHNTSGGKCQYCADGYHRDWTKPFSHSSVCIPCNCHKFGTLPNQSCNRKDGQCPCKPGVTGLRCHECAPGFQQTNDENVPCVKNMPNYAFRQIEMTRNKHPYMVPPPTQQRSSYTQQSNNNNLYHNTNQQSCRSCEPQKMKMGLRRFCRQHAVFMAKVVSQEVHSDAIRYNVQIKRVWRLLESTKRLLQIPPTSGNTPDMIPVSHVVPVWMNLIRTSPSCFCPDLKIGQSYLFISKALQKPYRSSLEFQVDQKRMMVIPWNDFWTQRLNGYFREQQRGTCQRFANPQNMFSRRANNRRMREIRTINDSANSYTSYYPNRNYPIYHN